MKKILSMGLALFIALTAYSQNEELSRKEKRQLEKELKKEQQAKEAAMKAQVVGLMVEYQRFVLEADRLRDKRGNQVNVTSNLNFIACDSLNAVIQIGQNSYVGLNGVGGITVEGPVGKYEFSFNEKNSVYNVNFNVRAATGNYDVRMTCYPDGRADATVSSNWPGKLNYAGFLVPPAQSRVFKGTSL
jgi:hypothetical protein